MNVLKWIIVIAAVLNFGYMLFDGGRALLKGDYIRPSSGDYAGQLGPWAKLVKAAGISPESAFMKMIFISWGLAGLFITVCYALDLPWSWKGMLLMNIASLWYLWMGTASSVLQLILLSVIRLMK